MILACVPFSHRKPQLSLQLFITYKTLHSRVLSYRIPFSSSRHGSVAVVSRGRPGPAQQGVPVNLASRLVLQPPPKGQPLQLLLVFHLQTLDRLGVERFVQLVDVIQSVQHVITGGIEGGLVARLPGHVRLRRAVPSRKVNTALARGEFVHFRRAGERRRTTSNKIIKTTAALPDSFAVASIIAPHIQASVPGECNDSYISIAPTQLEYTSTGGVGSAKSIERIIFSPRSSARSRP